MSEDNSAPQTQEAQIVYNITPQGVLLAIPLNPACSVNTFIGEHAMNEICRAWVKSRQEVKQQLELVKNVRNLRAN